MDLKTLIEKGAIVAQTPATEEISWTHLVNGEEVTDKFAVRIKKHSAGTIEEMWHEHGNGKKRSFQATLIAESILLGDEGKDRLTYKQAYDLDPTLAQEFVEAIDKINPVKKREKKA